MDLRSVPAMMMSHPEASLLIVDDDAVNRALMAGFLKGEQYHRMFASSGEEAIAMAAQVPPDLILLDIMMPGMSGIEVAEKLKQDQRTRTIPIIMITALTDRQSRLAALASGAEDILSKPVDRVELQMRVRNLLRLKHYQDFLSDHFGILENEITERTLQLERVNSRLVEAQDRLAQSERLASLGQLAAGVAHEINNPIAYVNANLGSLGKYLKHLLALLDAHQALPKNGHDDSPARQRIRALEAELDPEFLRDDALELIEESRHGIEAVRDIVQSLKDFARSDTSQEWRRADIHKGLDSALNIALNEIKHHADVSKHYGDLPEIDCLPAKLNQVFLNLLVNAGQAIAEKGKGRGHIGIRTGSDLRQVWVEISDTGCGIASEHLKRIFDPFFTTKPEGSGTGLGLSLSYGIVRVHGGRIEVQSKLGEGSTFRVSLPRLQSDTLPTA